ncbi:WcbI family polysaccharide biosynthesis putative acetyltransferase [Butyrivibrio sp. XPD2006]|uniref:WcbI family polysaccharide biosynthesis putative acetyltransferase n=1 Tax=Butyrivibrio sp. XPD2006 TaxID=1280668 RepID=UPI0003B2F1A9|nr:WcbI family polysaccharide biosynthesis putative acetyltransferase [Butyrivibrio sp. XPD2006]
MDKKEARKIILHEIATRNIILFGVGIVAEEFYEEFHDQLNIVCCMTNYSKEWGEKRFLERLDVRGYTPEDISNDDYIIICSYFSFNSIDRQLTLDGLKPFSDFISSGIAAAVYNRRKIALFYGSCILRDVYKNISMVPKFTSEFYSIFVQASKDPMAIMLSRELMYAKLLCDICIYMPRIMEKDSTFNVTQEMFSKDCKLVSVSNLVVPIYWPNVKSRLYARNPEYIYPYNSKRDLNFFHTLYRKEDVNINKLVENGLSTADIIKVLSSEDFYSEQQVLRKVKTTFHISELGEEGMDVKIVEYIKDNYQREMLYQNYVHPNRPIIWKLIEGILNCIGITDSSLSACELSAPYHPHQSGDVPIYPSVVKHMRLDFITPEHKYEIMTADGIKLMDFKEYVEHYAEYTRVSIKIRGLWNNAVDRKVWQN